MRCRTILWFLIFTGSTLNMLLMTNMNIAIVAMVKRVATQGDVKIAKVYNGSMCEFNSHYNLSSKIEQRESFEPELHQSAFDWNGHEQSMVLGAIYWLGWITNIPGGILANRYGPKIVFGWANFAATLLSFLTPMATYFHIYTLIVLRVIQGIIIGLTFPCLHTITARWVPPNERGSFITSYLGGAAAIFIGYPVFGWVVMVRRWDDIFYGSGHFGVLWCLAWYFLMYDSPSQHPRITDEERDYIERTLTDTEIKSPKKASAKTPWGSLLKSLQVWLNVFANFSFMWVFMFAQIYFPLFFRKVHHLEISSTAIIAGLPHFLRLLTSIFSSMAADTLLRNHILSRNTIRKLSTFTCTFIAASLLITLGYTKCDKNLAIFLVFIIVSCTGLPNSGFYAAMVDISPNFCSIIYGISLTAGTISVTILTSFIGFMTKSDNETLEKWQEIFMYTGSVGIIVGVVYLMFAKAEVQSWNSPYSNKGETELKDFTNNNQESQPLKHGQDLS